MHCSIKRKNCAIWQNTFFFGGGGHSWVVIQKIYNVFGGQEENVSSKENSPDPRNFINERSLIFIAEFERAAKIRKVAIYRFLISLLVPEL